MSFDIDAAGATSGSRWSGVTDYGTPVQIDDHTAALIERRAGVEFALWHLNFAEGTLHFIAAVNEGKKTPSGFDGVVWHRVGSDVVGEFVLVHTSEMGGNRFMGHSVIGEINLRSGTTKVKTDKVKFVTSEKVAIEKLLDKSRSRDTAIDLPDIEDVKSLIAESLAKRDMDFDFRRGRFVLSAHAREKLRRAVSECGTTGPAAMSRILDLQQTVNKLPSCPATRELAKQLEALGAKVR